MARIRFIRDGFFTGIVLGVLASWLGISTAQGQEPVPVKVGAYEYGVVYFFDDGKPSGMVPSLIRLLNDLQDEYAFELVETSSRRRYRSVTNGEVDLVLLESPKWEWEQLDVLFSDPIVQEQDLYLTLSGRGDAEMLFSDVTSYQMLCVLGFHYGFADFNADPEYLRGNFDVMLGYNEKEVLDGLLAGEAPIGVVSAGFLALEFGANPDVRDQVTIASQPDATYDLVSVLSDNSAISLEQFNQLIAELHDEGEVERLWQQLHRGVSR
ncbi:transporter substrate-binding domain-containing protein [Thalassospira sp. HJ]|uniref:transporter substrate-binding domain-containing protein n=1 Tax=Thalassospira sp. HJ TaxID=1616823 RepID=UPI001269FCF8|nr:transporter substrate-binding domain-containing protein [Thalassospira sp. HJ]